MVYKVCSRYPHVTKVLLLLALEAQLGKPAVLELAAAAEPHTYTCNARGCAVHERGTGCACWGARARKGGVAGLVLSRCDNQFLFGLERDMATLPLSFSLQALLLLLVLLPPLAQSQSCTSLAGSSCPECTRAGCSWCPVSGSCIPLTQSVSAGRCRFRMNAPDRCPESYCSKTAHYGSCGMCTLDYFCYWCAESRSCGAWGSCSSPRVIAYPCDCWAAAPPASPPTPPSPPALAPAPPAPAPAPAPAPPINSQPAYTPCVSGSPPTSCAPEQLSLQAMPNMCPAGPPNGPAYFAPFGIDPLSKCAIMPSRTMFAGDMSCSSTQVPSSCPASSKYWSSLGSMASCSTQRAEQSGGCGMCSPSVPIWAPYGRDTSGCPIVWCPQGCPFVWAIPSGPSPPPPAFGTPTSPSPPAPAPPSSCAGGLFATASDGGSSTCSPCPQGSFCPPGSNSPSPCPAGTASNYTGASSSQASAQATRSSIAS